MASQLWKDFWAGFRTKILYDPQVEKSIIDTFGFSDDYTIQYAEITKAVWLRDVLDQIDKNVDIDYDVEEMEKPKPGDLIKTLWDDCTYEITHVTAGERIFAGTKLVWSITMKPYVYDSESSTAKDVMFEELEIDDFPVYNKSREKITDKQLKRENKVVQKEAAENNNFDEIDPSVYGYFVKR